MNVESRPKAAPAGTDDLIPFPSLAGVADGRAGLALKLTLSDYVEEAARLEYENGQLRRMIVALMVWIAERDDLAGFARAEIEERWR